MPIKIRPISQEEAKGIREKILRPNYPLDWHQDSFHIGAFDGTLLIGICSVYHENPQQQLEQRAWRIRSIATLPEYQKQGIGRLLIEECLNYVRSKKGLFVWSNGHTAVGSFYEKCGFTLEGPRDSLPWIGAPLFYRKNIDLLDE
ncbi:MAG: GNAT family N-acetyltransferase [Simkaniaceae bacterium]|nr:GNAT family N-acetyltransferase [Simkaniaceae bacterium]